MPVVIRDEPLYTVVERWTSKRGLPWRAALVGRISERLVGWYSTADEAEAAATTAWRGIPVRAESAPATAPVRGRGRPPGPTAAVPASSYSYYELASYGGADEGEVDGAGEGYIYVDDERLRPIGEKNDKRSR